MVHRSYAAVEVVGFYNRASLNVDAGDGSTLVFSDRTPYSAYAERCRKSTVTTGKLKTEELAALTFREFSETIVQRWVADRNSTADDIDGTGKRTKRKIRTRNATAGHWSFTRRRNRTHVRWSTALYTEPAHLYKPVDPDDRTEQTTFFSLPANRRKQLYRSYMELVCYLPWTESPDATFLSDEQRTKLESDLLHPEHDQRYSLQRLEMFWDVYMRFWNAKKVAPPGSAWHKDNAYSHSMWLSNGHNSDMHTERVRNDGVLKATFEPADELQGTSADIRFDADVPIDESELPSPLNFLPSDIFRDVVDQSPPTVDEVKSAALCYAILCHQRSHFMLIAILYCISQLLF